MEDRNLTDEILKGYESLIRIDEGLAAVNKELARATAALRELLKEVRRKNGRTDQ